MGGEGLAEVGLALSGAVGLAHASAMGSGLGTFLLADDPPAPPNIFGEVAQGLVRELFCICVCFCCVVCVPFW